MTIGVKKNEKTIVFRIDGLRNEPPPLTMIINPANLSLNYSALINETRTLGGFVQEFWGEQLTSLSASGQTALFINEGEGITNENLRDTESYNNFIRLLNIYKSNGKEYRDERTKETLASKANPNRIVRFATVIMTYFGKEYHGYFENFTFKEDASKPFYFDYDFSFKITRIVGEFIVQQGKFTRTTDG